MTLNPYKPDHPPAILMTTNPYQPDTVYQCCECHGWDAMHLYYGSYFCHICYEEQLEREEPSSSRPYNRSYDIALTALSITLVCAALALLVGAVIGIFI